MPKSWDIFCNVVDNFGDIGVCWRLARQLANEQGAAVRLWVDKLESFQALCPQVDCRLAVQALQGVEIRHWSPAFGQDTVPAEAVVEGFGCRLPGVYLAAMAARAPQPVWINLEYLSAEDWVESHHGLPSPHPQLPLVKYFFFPGFTEHTGGLPVERDLGARREAFQGDTAAVNAFRAAIGLAPAQPDTLVSSLFCYEDAAVPELLDAWARGPSNIECLVPAGPPLRRAAVLTGPLRPGETWRSGSLQVKAIPFLDQDAYDRLLWASDLNFVRGEDSFVRAQLAARPLVWQVYAQDAGAHLLKMDAFLGRYCRDMDVTPATALRQFWQAWNRPLEGRPDWPALWQAVLAAKPAWQVGAQAWAARLHSVPSLADNLAFFCQSKLK